MIHLKWYNNNKISRFSCLLFQQYTVSIHTYISNLLFAGAVVATTEGEKNSKFVTLLDFKNDNLVQENRELEENRSLVQADRHSLVGKKTYTI